MAPGIRQDDIELGDELLGDRDPAAPVVGEAMGRDQGRESAFGAGAPVVELEPIGFDEARFPQHHLAVPLPLPNAATTTSRALQRRLATQYRLWPRRRRQVREEGTDRFKE